MKKLKIGILTEIINFHSGPRAPLEIARHIAKLGHDVTVYALDTKLSPSAKESLKKNGVKIKTFKRVNIPYFGKWITSISLYKTLKKDSPDLMTFSGTMPFFAAGKLTGKPIIRIYQGTQFDALLENVIPGEKIPLALSILNKIANVYIFLNDFISFRLANGIVCISKFAKDEGESLYRRKVDKIIYHGTSGLPHTAKSKGSSKTTKLISVSRITPYKGFHLIINAIRDLKDPLHLTIAGSQPKPKYIKYLKRIGGKNLKIVIDPTDRLLAKLYSINHIYVNADRYLYFGLPITEGASFRLPTISFDFAAAHELVIHGKTGFIAKTPTDFSVYLKKLINSPKLREKMGKEARDRAQNFFTWEKAAKQYLDLFEKII